MSRLGQAAKELDDFLRSQNWRYCLVGGLAVQRWGEPRATQDVDICLLTGIGDEQSFINLLVAHFKPRRADAAQFAEQNRVVLIQASNNVGIDVALGWMPFEEQMIARSSLYRLDPDVEVPTASAEDLVVTKAFAARSLDWVDVERILARQRGKLDWNYIRAELGNLCELTDSPENVEQLERIKAKIDAE
jgi:hypothetical protein